MQLHLVSYAFILQIDNIPEIKAATAEVKEYLSGLSEALKAQAAITDDLEAKASLLRKAENIDKIIAKLNANPDLASADKMHRIIQGVIAIDSSMYLPFTEMALVAAEKVNKTAKSINALLENIKV